MVKPLLVQHQGHAKALLNKPLRTAFFYKKVDNRNVLPQK